METRNQILTELQEIAPLLGKDGLSQVPYEIPSGYFADFPDLLMYRIRLEAEGFGETEKRFCPGGNLGNFSFTIRTTEQNDLSGSRQDFLNP